MIRYDCSVRKTRSDKLPAEEKSRRRRAFSSQYHKEHRAQINAQRRARRNGIALREYTLKFIHQMTIEQWESIWSLQQGLCYLCEKPMSRPRAGRGTARWTDASIDHDHACCPKGRSCPSCWRGLAHRSCNSVLGNVDDSPDILRLMADNLQRAKGGDALWPVRSKSAAEN